MTIYFALIADLIASRELKPRARRDLQQGLRHSLNTLNDRETWRPYRAARFAITLGDELQVLLASSKPIWDMAHAIRRLFPRVDWVVACGRGELTTPLSDDVPADELDGPCFHEARTVLDRAKRERLVFAFGGFKDERLEGFASYYSALYWSWTRRQREAANRFRAYWDPVLESLSPDAKETVVPSALSHLRRRLAWPLVEVGDRMFRALLEAS